MPSLIHYPAYTAPIPAIAVAEQTLPEWLPSQGRNLPLRPTNRNYTAMYEPQDFSAIGVEQWHPSLGRQYQLTPANRPYTALSLPTTVGIPPAAWHPSMHRQYPPPPANRLSTILAFPTTVGITIDQWYPSFGRNLPLRPPRREETVLIRLVEVGATDIDEWHPAFGRNLPLRPANRNYIAMYEPQDFAATPLPEWEPRLGRQYQLRPANRPYTVVSLPSTVGTLISEWALAFARQSPSLFRAHPDTAFTIQLLVVTAGTSPDQWTIYQPHQYRLRPSARDNTPFVVIPFVEPPAAVITRHRFPLLFVGR